MAHWLWLLTQQLGVFLVAIGMVLCMMLVTGAFEVPCDDATCDLATPSSPSAVWPAGAPATLPLCSDLCVGGGTADWTRCKHNRDCPSKQCVKLPRDGRRCVP